MTFSDLFRGLEGANQQNGIEATYRTPANVYHPVDTVVFRLAVEISVYTQNPSSRVNECNRDFSTVTTSRACAESTPMVKVGNRNAVCKKAPLKQDPVAEYPQSAIYQG